MVHDQDFNPSRADSGDTPVHLAAVDLGSNSFHLLVARLDQGEPRVVERLKFRVGLAAGVDAAGALDAARFALACDAMRRIADRIGGIPRSHVRAVGTSALRTLADPGEFLEAARKLLGVPVRIVSGDEEARLIFAGAADTLPESRGRRLIIDIGGGSTEFALGAGQQPEDCLSVQLGCVGVSREALAIADPRTAMDHALALANNALDVAALDRFRDAGAETIATSGTAESLRDVLRARGEGPEAITVAGLRSLYAMLAEAPTLPVSLPGLDPDREDVFPGGLAILLAIMERLGLETLEWTDGALQDGVIRELVPLPAEGLRARTLAALQRRFGVDPEHARALGAVADDLFVQLADAFGLTLEHRALLAAAARVHDLGLAVAAAHHERHGAWLLRNAELRGFTADERLVLIALVRGHRGPWPETSIRALDAPLRQTCDLLCLALRLAVILKRLDGEQVPPLYCRSGEIEMRLPLAWRSDHPFLTEALEQECMLLGQSLRAPRLQLSWVP